MWRHLRVRTLGGKIVVVLLVVVVLNLAVDAVMQNGRISSSYRTLEEKAAYEQVERAQALVEDELADLSAEAARWADWDETCRFVAGEDPDFARAYLGPWTLAKARLDLLFLCDSTGRVAWQRVEDPVSHAELHLREFPEQALSLSHPLMLPLHDEDGGALTGLMAVGDRTMLVGSRDIRSTRGEGPSRGRVLVGRFLDGAFLEELGRRARVSFRVWPLLGTSLPADVEDLRDEITGRPSGEFIHEELEDKRYVYSTLNSVLDQPELVLRVEMGREITASGRESARFALLSSLSSAVLILFVLMRLLRRVVVRPLSELTEHVVEIGRTDDTHIHVAMDRDDEIGSLSREFDGMMEKLEHSRRELVKTARRAGMSEIATGVLHNVGNVLNSVNVSASLVRGKLDKLRVQDLERLTKVLQENGDRLGEFVTTDPRGKHLLPFLCELQASLSAEHRELSGELRNLRRGIDHMADLVRSQQTYAGTKGVFEQANLAEEVEAALKITAQSSGDGLGVQLVRTFEDVPPVWVDRHKLMEILVNLIQNAYQAVRDAGIAAPRVEVRVRAEGDRARVEVIDNGVGIPPEDVARVFHHGFTTKPDGHGFGLHVSANAATEMSAALHAQSAGPGRGATFSLELPLGAQEPAIAAA